MFAELECYGASLYPVWRKDKSLPLTADLVLRLLLASLPAPQAKTVTRRRYEDAT
jgi:hypothetical protein